MIHVEDIMSTIGGGGCSVHLRDTMSTSGGHHDSCGGAN